MISVSEPILEKILPSLNCNSSFAIKEEVLSFIKIGWHFHPEYELVLFTESTGKVLIGDYKDTFAPGDIFFIGPNLPHYMRNDKKYYQGDPSLKIRAIVIHFDPNFLGETFLGVPEMESIKELLKKSSRGIKICGDLRMNLAHKMEKIIKANNYYRLRILLDILYLISISKDYKILTSFGFENSYVPKAHNRIDKVFDYLFKNFREEIKLQEVSELCYMTPSTFCKFFKKHTGRTLFEILNEIRIGQACKQFIEKDTNVTEVCFSCGFNSLSYFNRVFKEYTNYTPLEYQKIFFKGYKKNLTRVLFKNSGRYQRL